MLRRREQESNNGTASWMNTYGDMVTLLLTFFVLLYSFSSVDAVKWQALVVSLSGGNKGVLKSEAEVTELDKANDFVMDEFSQLKSELEEFHALYENISDYLHENGLEAQIIISKTDSEIQIRFADNVLFDSGKANIKTEALEILEKITFALSSYKETIRMVRIEGHTDNVVINTQQFPSNWELSTARAVEVLRFLVERRQFDPKTVSAVGYGEYHPIAENTTDTGRASNRRVDFVISRNARE